jgi:hypothetical protein
MWPPTLISTVVPSTELRSAMTGGSTLLPPLAGAVVVALESSSSPHAVRTPTEQDNATRAAARLRRVARWAWLVVVMAGIVTPGLGSARGWSSTIGGARVVPWTTARHAGWPW